MAKKTAAQRAAKKHAKEVKRKKRLAARPAPTTPESRWKPEVEGIAGLARRMDVDRHVAATLAEQLYASGERPDAAAAWLPSRVDALSTDALLERLQALGIDADAESFAALALEHASTIRLFESAWSPHLPIDATVHDADLAAEAVEALWGRWLPDVLPEEWVRDTLFDATDAINEREFDECLALLLDIWGMAGEDPLAWLKRCNVVTDYGTLLYDVLLDASAGLEVDEGAQILKVVAPHVDEHGTLDPDGEFMADVNELLERHRGAAGC